MLVMVAFILDVIVPERLLTSRIILKFELLYASFHGAFLVGQNPLSFSPASVHEVCVPPKAFLGDDDRSEHSLGGSTIMSNQEMSYVESGVDAKDISLWKALCASRDILINEIQSIAGGNN